MEEPKYQGKNMHLDSPFTELYAPMAKKFTRILFELSPREREIIFYMTLGLKRQEIGRRLHISKHTVDTHRKNIYKKGKFNGIHHVILFALFVDLSQKNTRQRVFPRALLCTNLVRACS